MWLPVLTKQLVSLPWLLFFFLWTRKDVVECTLDITVSAQEIQKIFFGKLHFICFSWWNLICLIFSVFSLFGAYLTSLRHCSAGACAKLEVKTVKLLLLLPSTMVWTAELFSNFITVIEFLHKILKWNAFQCSIEYIHYFWFLTRLDFTAQVLPWHLSITGNRKSKSKSTSDIRNPWGPYSQNQSRHLWSMPCLYALDFNLYAFLGPFF